MLTGIHVVKEFLSGGESGGTDIVGTDTPGGAEGNGSESAMIRQPELAALYQFWVDKKSSLGRLPSRSDFTPHELRKLLPHIALVDVDSSGDEAEFCFRLCGTQIATDAGVDLTGKTWAHQPASTSLMKRARKLVDDHTPYYAFNIRADWAPKSFHHYSVLALPLSATGDTVNMILYGMIFHADTQ